MTRFNWQKLDSGAWGVKESGDFGRTGKLTGQTVSVRKRDGSVSLVTLGRVVASWNGRAAVYEVGGPTKYAHHAPTCACDKCTYGREIVSTAEDY